MSHLLRLLELYHLPSAARDLILQYYPAFADPVVTVMLSVGSR